MLIEELINTKTRTVVKPTDNIHHKPKRKDLIGRGKMATAHHIPDNEFEVQKRSRLVVVRDGYDDYVDHLIKKKMMGANPYAPIIYRKVRIESKSKNVYSYRMEKLYSIQDLIGTYDDEALSKILFSITERLGVKLVGNEKNSPLAMHKRITEYIRRVAFEIHDTDDSELSAICEMIYMLASDNTYSIDLHDGNILYRKTQYGLQPVISDPLYSPWDY